MPRTVSISNRHPRLRLERRAVVAAIRALDEAAPRWPLPAPHHGCPPGELSLVFLTDDALAQLHADFLDDPSRTDVITFEGDPAAGFAGEICVSADTAARYAAEHDGEFSRELTLYLVHGWLHLAGHDDLQPAKKRRMRAAEARAMKHLGETGRMPAFRWR